MCFLGCLQGRLPEGAAALARYLHSCVRFPDHGADPTIRIPEKPLGFLSNIWVTHLKDNQGFN